jgi:hypothetical protein
VANEDDAEGFFEDLFPEWLLRLTAWTASETLTALAERVAAACIAYVRNRADDRERVADGGRSVELATKCHRGSTS